MEEERLDHSRQEQENGIDIAMPIRITLITPRACARGKVIGRVVVVVSTKIALFRDIGV